MAELNFALYSGWKALKRVYVAPRVPLNGSLSQRSLAYLRACACYLKEMNSDTMSEESVVGPSSNVRDVNESSAVNDHPLLEAIIEMRMRGKRNANREEKDMEPTIVNGDGTET